MNNVGLLKFVFVALVATSFQHAFGMEANPAPKLAVCTICITDPANQVVHANHAFCAECLGERIDLAHRERNGADVDQMLRCPFQGCEYGITEADVRRIIPARLPQFQDIQRTRAEKRNFVADKAKQEAKAQQDDRSNLVWKFKNTKPCPTCNTAIEKNQGCQHVICTQCRTDFCWLCLGIHNHRAHNPCIPADPWKAEKEKLNAEQTVQNVAITISGIALIAAIWGISELYDWFQTKKSKRAAARKQAAAKKTAPAAQRRVPAQYGTARS